MGRQKRASRVAELEAVIAGFRAENDKLRSRLYEAQVSESKAQERNTELSCRISDLTVQLKKQDRERLTPAQVVGLVNALVPRPAAPPPGPAYGPRETFLKEPAEVTYTVGNGRIANITEWEPK